MFSRKIKVKCEIQYNCETYALVVVGLHKCLLTIIVEKLTISLILVLRRMMTGDNRLFITSYSECRVRACRFKGIQM